MIDASHQLAREYRAALHGYIEERAEAHLQHAYELGRQAAESDMGVLDIVSLHCGALVAIAQGLSTVEEVTQAMQASGNVFAEAVAPFEMIHRGFREANVKLSELNATLEARVAQQTRDLQSALGALRKVFGATIEAISMMVERRDPYTAGHQQRVAELACAIVQEMGWPFERIDGIRTAGLLHDVGKIAVPAEMLSKPGRLETYEFNVIQGHVPIGVEILKTIEFATPVVVAVLQHHERLDGSGYPAGLTDDQIIPEACALAVADVIEAMSSHRPYRPALGMVVALDEIAAKRGALYSPEVVDACLAVFRGGFEFA